MYKIMIVEDDSTIAKIVENHLCKWGMVAFSIENFEDVLKEVITTKPDLILLDISLPFYNGYHWCSKIREISKVPIIFLTSHSDKMNLVMAMNMGGDDLIAKPFDLDVVVAKVQALLRRSYAFTGDQSVLEHKGLLLHLGEGVATYKDHKIELTKNDFKMLQILMQKGGETVSREELMKKLWDEECFVDDNTLSVNIARLRKKLEEVGLDNLIITKKGQGYRLGDI
jgi:DNA-binding response OmpR family regulator